MSFDWLDYLDLAKELQQNSKIDKNVTEAKLRTAISRSYYSVFNFVKNYLISQGEMFSKSAKAHREIREKLNNMAKEEKNGDRKNKLIGIARGLNILRNFRNNADYDDHFNNIDKFAMDAIIRSEEIEMSIKNLK